MDAPHTSFAVNAFGTSGASGLYDRARPDYTPEALQSILTTLKEGPKSEGNKAKIVELGSGTGIFTRCLINADQEDTIGEILAVEPSPGMREGFNKSVKNSTFDVKGKKVETVEGLFNQIPAGDSTVDLVVIAQAWHWCVEKDQDASLVEIARVLKKGGSLALIWNMEDRNSANWVAQLRDTYEQHEYGVPQYRTGLWKKMFDAPSYPKLFGNPLENHYNRIVKTTKEGVKERIASKSYITALEPQVREKVMEKADEILQKADDIKWIDQSAGEFEYPYVTDVYIMKKL
eukprot:TRINITY_DN1948_c0_g1_i1.p1 TRINITY_DN1948_c0_g1~~TRINITY_DN1948_c0_g1_i1.p1  ORF type:complete len:289 (-),score=99.30 TRINITY_DN1948_c0_g1_i1:30-896(-)